MFQMTIPSKDEGLFDGKNSLSELFGRNEITKTICFPKIKFTFQKYGGTNPMARSYAEKTSANKRHD